MNCLIPEKMKTLTTTTLEISEQEVLLNRFTDMMKKNMENAGKREVIAYFEVCK